MTMALLCCQLFTGTHDFQAFSGNDATNARQGNTVRTISKFGIINSPTAEVDGLIKPIHAMKNISDFQRIKTKTYQIIVTGDRFMYKMVRILIGAIVAVGMGKESLDCVQKVLVEGRGNRYKLCAPAHGLALCNVSYPINFTFKWRAQRDTGDTNKY